MNYLDIRRHYKSCKMTSINDTRAYVMRGDPSIEIHWWQSINKFVCVDWFDQHYEQMPFDSLAEAMEHGLGRTVTVKSLN